MHGLRIALCVVPTLRRSGTRLSIRAEQRTSFLRTMSLSKRRKMVSIQAGAHRAGPFATIWSGTIQVTEFFWPRVQVTRSLAIIFSWVMALTELIATEAVTRFVAIFPKVTASLADPSIETGS